MAAIYQWFRPPGEFLLTSPIYPIEGIDEMNWSTETVSAVLADVFQEALDFDLVPLSGTVETILLNDSVPEENLDFDLLPLSGTVETVLLNGSVPEENLEFDMVPLSGSVEGILVEHDNPAEALDWSTQTISASLT